MAQGGLRWCLFHPQRRREGGLSQGQATGCAACMCPGPGGCVVLGGTGPVSVVGHAVPSMGAHLAAHRVPVLLQAQPHITGSSGESPGAPALLGV